MASSLLSVRSRSLTILVAGCIATALFSGCEDPAMEKQRAFERQFNEVAASYSSTLGAHPDLFGSDPSDESLTALRGVADRAKGLSGGTNGQLAAARGLAASVYRTAAAIGISRAMAIESNLANDARLAVGYADIAATLDAVANAAENLDLAEARADASGSKDAASSAARKAQESLRQVEGPASQLEAAAAKGSARLRELGQEAAVLLRKARELSPSAGLEFVEQAAAVQAEARTVALKTAYEQGEAETLKGEATVQKAQLAAQQALQAAATEALELLNNLDADLDGQAKKAREMAAELRGSAESLVRSIGDVRNGALKAAYAAAAEDLSNCTAESDSDSMRWTVMAEELRLGTSTLEGLVSQGRLIASISGKSAAGLAGIESAAGELQASLKEKATAASDAFGNMGEDPVFASLKSYADGAKKLAETSLDTLMAPPQAVEPAMSASSGSKSSGRSMSGGSGGSGGVADIEAFVAQLNSATASDPIAASEMMLSIMDDSTAEGKAMKSMSVAMLSATGDMMKAIVETWGVEALAELGASAGGGMGGGMGAGLAGGPVKLTKKSIDGDRAVFSSGTGEDVVFVKSSSGWKADMTASMAPEQLEQIKQMGPMLSMMMGPLGKASKAVAARIRSGDIASVEEVPAAIAEEMQKAAGGFGGFGG